MTAQQLKNSILQMAVQGKLVPQDPNDEPASVLLERIKAEKQELIKQGKIQKDKKASDIFRGSSRNLPYTFCEQIGKEIRDISDEIPFDIPESWVWCRLGEICNIINGFTPLRSNKTFWNSNDIPWFTIEDIHLQGRVISSTKQFISNAALSDDSNRILPVNTVLLCCTASVGEYAVTKIPLTTNQQFNGLVIKTNYKNYYYYKFLFHIVSNLKDTLIQMAGKTTFNFLSVKKLSSILLPFPPLAEQHRIVAKIEELLPYIEEYDKAETRLTTLNEKFPEALKKSILQEAVQGKLVPQDPNDEPASVLLERIKAEKQRLIKEGKIKKDKHESAIVTRDKIPYEIIDGKERCIADEVPFELPDSWALCRLKSILNAVSARRVHQSDWKRSGIPFYRAREIAKLADNGYVDNELFISEKLFDEYSKSGIPKSGDIMVTAVGTLGKTYIVKETDKFYYKDASVICLENFSKINSGYIKYLLMSPYMESIIKDNSSGTTVGTITLVKANEYLIPLPPLAEQKRIVARIEELMQYCDKL